MKQAIYTILGAALIATPFAAPLAIAQTAQQAPPQQTLAWSAKAHAPKGVVDIELLTWPEIYKAIHEEGKTTVIVFNGGTEQRGPQGTTGAHTIIAHYVADEVARRLGNALVAPVLPISVNRANANLPGTIGFNGPLFEEINEQIVEQLIANGFKNVVLAGDHGGGQKELKDLAAKLEAKHAPDGVHVFFSEGAYTPSNTDYFAWLDKNGYPPSEHAGIPDTSELIFLEKAEGEEGKWIRKDLVPEALGDVPPKPGERPSQDSLKQRNGIIGDARRSSYELGKRFLDMKVDYATKEIRAWQDSLPKASK